MEATLRALWAQGLGVAAVDADADFFALGGQSLAGARILAAIADAFGPRLGLAAFFAAPTPRAMAEVITGVRPTPAFSPLVPIRRGEPGGPLVGLVHGAGGNVLLFHALADRLRKAARIHGFQAPGVAGPEGPLDDVATMAARYVAALKEAEGLAPHGLVLGGYSSGGVIALAMAQALRSEGVRVDLVALFDTIEPSRMRDQFSLLERLRLLPQVSPDVVAAWARRRFAPEDTLAADTGGTFLEARAAAVIEAHERALSGFTPPAYAGRVVLFRARRARLSYVAAGPTLGWDDILRGALEVVDVDAGHDDLFDGAGLGQIARALDERLPGS